MTDEFPHLRGIIPDDLVDVAVGGKRVAGEFLESDPTKAKI
jgi:hypothetical protein